MMVALVFIARYDIRCSLEKPEFGLSVLTVLSVKLIFLRFRFCVTVQAYIASVGYDAKHASDPLGLLSPPAHRVHVVALPELLKVPSAHD